MTAFLIVLAVAAEAYLLGSVDTGILVSKYLYHDDVRTHGSGAAGMTNMLRTFGKKAAALTAVGDVLKGVVAVCLGRWLFSHLPADAAISPYLGVYLAAILAVVGHSKPIYFGFKGGKGVLVAAGAILAVQPVLLPVLALIFLACLLPTGMVSLQHHDGCSLSGADAGVQPPARPADAGRRGLHRGRCHRGRHGHLDAPHQYPAHPGRQGVPFRSEAQE